jgi:hypothetical protein
VVAHVAEHTHIWMLATKPTRCILCRRPLLPWHRRLQQRVTLWLVERKADWYAGRLLKVMSVTKEQ